jgi:F-type H+-transporting ATPase subunit b
MPQIQQIGTFASQIFWLVVTFVALYLILRYTAIPKITRVLEQRRERLDGDLERAASLSQEAEATLAEYEASLAEGRAKAQEAIRQTTDAMAAKAADEHASLSERLAKEVRDAEARIASARDAAIADIRTVSAEVAQTAVERLAGVEVDKKSAEAAAKAAADARS